jgi:hypothetical protein
MLQLRKHNIFTRVGEGDHHSLGLNVGPHPATVGFLQNWKLKLKNALNRSIGSVLKSYLLVFSSVPESDPDLYDRTSWIRILLSTSKKN